MSSSSSTDASSISKTAYDYGPCRNKDCLAQPGCQLYISSSDNPGICNTCNCVSTSHDLLGRWIQGQYIPTVTARKVTSTPIAASGRSLPFFERVTNYVTPAAERKKAFAPKRSMDETSDTKSCQKKSKAEKKTLSFLYFDMYDDEGKDVEDMPAEYHALKQLSQAEYSQFYEDMDISVGSKDMHSLISRHIKLIGDEILRRSYANEDGELEFYISSRDNAKKAAVPTFHWSGDFPKKIVLLDWAYKGFLYIVIHPRCKTEQAGTVFKQKVPTSSISEDIHELSD